MEYGTVCSGVEAFGPAWHRLGFRPVFHAEIATHPAAVLRHHYPNVPNYGDFTTIESSPATRIGLLAGGTPCQDFSVAGLRKGLAGHRGNLTLEFARLAERLRPRWLVWENVPGVLSADGGRAFGQFLTLLAECGYYAAYRVLDAQHFGVPQRRRRVFVVAYLGDWRPAAAVLFERESLRGDSAPRYQARQETAPGSTRGVEFGSGVAGTMTATVSGHGPASRNEMAVAGYLQVVQAFGGNNSSGPIDVSTTLLAHKGASGRLDFASETFVTGTLCAGGKSAGSYTQQDAHNGLLVPIAPQGYTIHGTPAAEVASESDTAQCLRARTPGALENSSNTVVLQPEPVRTGGSHQDVIFHEDGVMNCIPAGSNGNGGSYTKTLIGSAVRRLTPRECERLMGYPDDWTRFGVKPNGQIYEVADGPRYQMCGNGWATDVAEWVGARVMMVDKLLNVPEYASH